MSNLRLLSRTLLTASLALAPMAAFAAHETPSDLLGAVMAHNKPMAFSFQLQAQKAPYYATVWMTGTAKGTTPMDMMLAAKSTMDVVWNNGNVRVKLEMRHVDGKMFVTVDDVQGKMEDATAKLVASFKMKKWFQIPMQDMGMTDMGSMGMPGMMMGDMSWANDTFAMTSAPGKNGTTVYTLTLKDDAMESFKAALQEMEITAGNNAQEAFFDQPSFSLTLVMDKADSLASINVALSAKNAAGILKFTGSAWPVSSFTVAAPKSVLSMDEGLFGFGQTSVDGWPSWIGQPTTDLNANDNWMENMIVPDDHSSWSSSSSEIMDGPTAPVCNASELRRGECPGLMPVSPRRQ